MKIRKFLSGGTAIAVAVAVSVVSVPLAHAATTDSTTPGAYNVVQTQRLLDTRRGVGAPEVPVAARATLTFHATTAIDPKVKVAAVVLNVTAVGPKQYGFLTVYPTGTRLPLASNLNFQAGQNVPNLVVTPVAANGDVSIYNGSNGTVDMLADIHGYYVGGTNTGVLGTFVPMPSQRFLDTRGGIPGRAPQVGPKAVLKLQIAGTHGIPTNAYAVVANVTAVHGAGKGFITVYQGDPMPFVSNLNYEKGQDRANLSLIALAADGSLSLYNGSPTAVDLVVDITGYYVGGGDPTNGPAANGALVTGTPIRIFDTRLPGGEPAGALTTSQILIPGFQDPFVRSVFKSVVVNVTAVEPQAAGFLTTYDGVGLLPSVSSSNFQPNHDVAGEVVLPVNPGDPNQTPDPGGTISIYNGSYGNVQLVVDLTGYILAPSPFLAVTNGTQAKASGVPNANRIAKALAIIKKASHTPAASPVSIKVK